jgi:hypothetical protein
MLNLQLMFPKSAPAGAPPAPAPFQGTTLNVQPAPGGAAPTAPSDPFPRTSAAGADLEAVRAGIRNIVETTAVDLSVAHTLAGGNAVVLTIQGTALMIDKGADVGNATLHIQDQTATPVNSINVFPGDTYDLPFTFIVIENAAQAGKVLRIHYGTGIAFKPSLAGTLTIAGNVAITQTVAGTPQGADQATSNGRAYGTIHSAGHVGANDAVCMIKNPVGSGKRIYIDSIRCSAFAAQISQWGVFLGATVDGASVADGAIGVNKKTAAKDGVALFFRDFAGTVLGGFEVDILESPNSGGEILHRPSTPIILDPGQRCHTAYPGAIAGGQNTTAWEFREY